jgi:mannosyltransferase
MPWEANFSALLLAVSYHHIWFSQNARGYTGLLFWVLAGTALFLRGIQRPSWRVWIGYAFVVAAAAYTHLSAGFFFMIHGLVYLLLVAMRGRLGTRYPGIAGLKPLGGFILGGLLVFLLHAPLLPQLIEAMKSVSVSAASETTVKEWKNPIWTLFEVVRNLKSLGLLAVVGLPTVLGFSTLGAISLSRRHPIFVAITLTHIPLTLLCLLLLSFRIWPRYFFIDLAFIFLCLVHGVFVFTNYFSRTLNASRRYSLSAEKAGIVVSSIAVFCSMFLLPQNYRYPKQDFLGARDFVEAARKPGDIVASAGLASYAFSRYYAPSWRVVESVQELQESSGQGRLWLVYTSPIHMAENYPEIMTSLKKDFELVKQFPGTLGDGSVLVYQSQSQAKTDSRP